MRRFSTSLYAVLTLFSPLTGAADGNGVEAEKESGLPVTCWELLMSESVNSKKAAYARLHADLDEFASTEQLGKKEVMFRDGAYNYFAKRVLFLNESGKLRLVNVNVNRFSDLPHYRDLIDIGSQPPRGIVFSLDNVNYFVVPSEIFREMRSITAKDLHKEDPNQNKAPAERIKGMAKIDRLGGTISTPTSFSAPVLSQTHLTVPSLPSQTKLNRWSLSEFTIDKKWEFIFAPSRSRLSPERPLAIISFFNRPGWIALDFNFFKLYGVDQAVSMITRVTGIKQLDQLTLNKLSSLYTQSEKEIETIPSRRLRGDGGRARMNDLVRDQKIMVAESVDGERHRVIIIPLMSLQDEDPRPVKHTDEKRATPPPTNVLQKFSDSFAPPAPVARNPLTDIYADNAPAIKSLVVFLNSTPTWSNFVTQREYLERQMWMNLHLAIPVDWSVGKYELPLLWFDKWNEFRIGQVVFKFSRGDAGEGYLEIESISELDENLQRDFFVRFARFHRIANSTFNYPSPISVGTQKTTTLVLPGHVQAKLMLKHRLEIDDIRGILSHVKSVPKSERALQTKVRFNNVEYHVILGHNQLENTYFIRSIYSKDKEGWPWLDRLLGL